MTQGKIVPLLLKFSAPLLLGNLFQQFYNTFDTFIVGRVIGSQALAAIGSTSHFVNTVINFFNGLAIGAQVVISQLFGAKNFPSLKKAINTTIYASFIFSILATVIQIILSPFVLRLISTPPDVLVQANQYLKIYFLGTAALTLYNMGSGILRALGDSTRALIFLVISSVSNIVLDILFVVLLGKGIAGAAYATVLSELLSAILVIISLQRLEVKMRLELKHPQIDFLILKKIMKLGLPGAISSSITSFSNTFMQKYINYFGTSCMAGWAIFSKFDQFAILPMHSLASGATTFVAQNYGAKKSERIRDGIKKSFILNFSVISILSLLLIFQANFFASLFSDDVEVIYFAERFIYLTAPFFVLCGFSMLFSNVMRGFGIAFRPTIITFVGFVLFRQIMLLIISQTSNSFILIALVYPAAWPLVIIIYIIWLFIFRKKRIK
ncbi:MATE family efflux transporter [Treponema bryantii]|uniref:MATE family efflux transporter n=1 Tax=Treponema bryantii TaxID=163 RepID=UPI0030C7EDA0